MSAVLEDGTKKATVIDVDVAKARTLASAIFQACAELEDVQAAEHNRKSCEGRPTAVPSGHEPGGAADMTLTERPDSVVVTFEKGVPVRATSHNSGFATREGTRVASSWRWVAGGRAAPSCSGP